MRSERLADKYTVQQYILVNMKHAKVEKKTDNAGGGKFFFRLPET